jgi:hypothetical protein
MHLFPYDACNRSLVEHFDLICAGSNEKKIVSQSSVWPYVMLKTSWSIWEDEEKFQGLTQTPRATHILVFLVVQTSEVPRISSEVPRFAAGTQPPGKSSEVPSFWKFRSIKSPESRWLSRIRHSWRYACIRSWWSLEEMVVELTGKTGRTGLPNRSDRFRPSAVWLCIELQD